MSDPFGREKGLLEEISALKKRIRELEQSEAERKRMEKELSVSRDRLSRAEIISRCGNWEFDLKSKRVFASEGAHRIYGMPPGELTIPEVQTIPLPEYRDMLNEALQGLIDENLPYNVEFKIRRPDTGEIIDIHSVAEYDHQRNVVFGIIQDVTDRKRVEEALRDAQARYRLLFQYAPYGIVIIDPATLHFVDFNETAHQQLGYSWEEFADLTISDFEVVESPEEVKRHAENIVRAGRDDFESKHRTKQGEIRNIHVTAQITRISGQKLYHCVWRDITNTKRAEEALHLNAERTRTLLQLNQMTGATLQEITDFVLEKAVQLTGSTIGYLAFLNEDESVLTMHSWSRSAMAECSVAQKPINYPVTKTGLWGEAVRQRKPVITNDYHSPNPWKKGYPDGHVQILRHMNVPVFADSRIVLVAGVGNKLQEYDVADVQQLTLLMEGMWRLIEHKRAEEALRESEERFRTLFESSRDAILMMDAEGMVSYWNPAAEHIFGYTANEAVGRNLHELIAPERYREAHRAAYPDFIATGQGAALGKTLELQAIRKDGSELIVSLSLSATRINDEWHAVGILCDITERKRWLEALEESEERYRTVVEHSRDGIAIIGGGVHIYVNQRFLDMFGFHSAEEVLGKPHSVTVHPDDLEQVVTINRERQDGGIVPSTYEFKGIRKDGSTIFIDVSATRIMYKGNYDSLVFLRDITDRKRAEDALLKSEQTLQEERDKLRTISENAPFGIALIDKSGLFTYVNPKFRELFGFDPTDTPDGRTWLRRAYPNAEYRHMVASAWTEDLKDAKLGEQKPRVFNVTCKDGTQRVVSFIASALVSGDYLMACEDITDLKHLESQLRQAQKMEAVGTLAGGIAHDFNNILTTIIGYSSLLQMNMDRSNPLKLYVDPILSATQKAADLTQSLLAFSRQQPVTLSPLDINKTIKETKRLLSRLLTEDIVLHTSFTVDDTIVMADKTQVDQILFNLVTNARDAMPKGGALTIETDTVEIGGEFIRTHGFAEPGRYVMIKISDTGTGMDEATLENIFEPFFTTKEVGKGTGLGLATVYGIVKQHGGHITVDSRPDQGTAFRIYLPAVRATVDQEEEKTVSVKRGSETILIAEDNEGVRHFVRDVLQKYGYETIEAMDGEDAIEKFTQHRDTDLIILDSVMPKKNGREVYEVIHGIQPSIKALFTSGYTKDIVLDKGIEDKDFDFIAKPLSPTALLQKVREILDR